LVVGRSREERERSIKDCAVEVSGGKRPTKSEETAGEVTEKKKKKKKKTKVRINTPLEENS